MKPDYLIRQTIMIPAYNAVRGQRDSGREEGMFGGGSFAGGNSSAR